jgi:lipoprotein-anchoring transpeptidase ErfK/SrfK
MRARAAVISLLACLLGGPAAADAQVPAPPPPERIAAGVTSVRVPLEGLTVGEAAAALRRWARPRVQRRLRVVIGHRTFVLTTGRLRLRFDARATARRALRAGRRAHGRPVSVGPVLHYRRASLSAFVRRATQVSTRRARNARIRITVRRIVGRRAAYGRRIDPRRLDLALRRRIRDPLRHRGVRPAYRRVRPAVRLIDLRRRNPTIVTIDRRGFRLRLFKHLRYDRSYGIAVGMAGLETPAGLYRIQNKQVNPAWHVPNAPWAGPYAGQTVPGGAPDNPLRARWMGIAGGVGIHGTSEPWSIGSAASHGCIRMRVPDVIDLYGRVPVGTPVLIR